MFKDIMTLKTYAKDGIEKKSWQKVGTLKEFNGKQYIDLFMFPETSFFVFDNAKDGDGGSTLNDNDVSNINF